MKFCWHNWKFETVKIQSFSGRMFQPMYCTKCGKAKIRWIS